MSFNALYILPVRGDNRYAAVTSIFVSSPDVDAIRSEMRLPPRYSPGRPARYTFAAVDNPRLPHDDAALVLQMESIPAVSQWLKR